MREGKSKASEGDDELPLNALARAGRSDERPPTLVLDGVMLDLAEKVFRRGKFKIANHFEV